MTLLDQLKTLKQAPLTENEETYQEELAAAALLFWSGDINRQQFENQMETVVTDNFRQAWLDGAEEGGVSESELTIDEEDALQQRTNEELGFIAAYALWLSTHTQADGFDFGVTQSHTDSWANRWLEVLTQGRGLAAADQKEKWVWNPDKEHCTDCRTLNGRVYRNSVWNRWGIYPRSSSLACFGTHCGCERRPTDEPVTPGRPPSLKGPGK
jgi:hypothetical protein